MLRMVLQYKNPDSSADINLRFKDVFGKGFVTGGDITPSGIQLTVDVSPFVLVNFDGAVVVSDAIETLTVIDNQVNYVVCRSRYRNQDTPILSMEVLSQAAYTADPELSWLHVVSVVDLTVGAPHTFVPSSAVSYDLRDELDQQGRSFWRDPVATAGSLPTTKNRDGDTRLVLDTGSLYWWKSSASAWQLFDEVPLQIHRDREHVNGITGDSAGNTLAPGVSVLNLTIDPVPAGSAYTVDGQFLTVPTAQQVISAAGVGASRGLIQAYMDSTGAVQTNFRVIKSPDVLDIAAAQIVDISDAHATGQFTLTFDPVFQVLTWNGGAPVNVVTGNKYRLYGSDMREWIDVSLSGALPGVVSSDNYDVNSFAGIDTQLLVGYWFWDGSAVLSLGSDRRQFGTLGYENVSDSMKDGVLAPPTNDLRGDMIYSGGAVTALTGLNVRVTGPIIAYVNGVRYEVAGSYSGIAMTDAATNYIHVIDAGVLTVTTTAPTGNVANIAEVVTAAGAISSITDVRDPQLIVGQATRNAYLKLALADQVKWDVANQRLSTERNGSTSNTSFETGTARVSDNVVEATTGALQIRDTNTGTALALTNTLDTDVNFVPSVSPQSVFTSIRSNQEVGQHGFGVISGIGADYNATILNAALRQVELEQGRLVDGLGRRVDDQNLQTLTLPSGPNTSHVLYWSSNTNTWATANIALASLSSRDIPIAICRVDGTDSLSQIKQIHCFSDGGRAKNEVTVGGSGNFQTLEQALLWLSCFSSVQTTRKRVIIKGNVSAGTIDMTDPDFAQAGRLEGLVIEGNAGAGKPAISWNTATPMANFNNLVKDVTIRDVAISYTGAGTADDHNVCVFKNPGPGFRCDGVVVDGGNALTHVALWDGTNTDFGGGLNSSTNRGTEFDGVVARNMFIADGGDANSYFRAVPAVGATVRGQFDVRGGTYQSPTNAGHYLFDQQGKTGIGMQARIHVDGVDVNDINIALFRDGGTWETSQRTVSKCKVTPTAGSNVSFNSTIASSIDVSGHVFNGETHSLLGARNVVESATKASAVVVGDSSVTSKRCEFNADGGVFKGTSGRLLHCKLALGNTAADSVLVGAPPGIPALIHNCVLTKSASAAPGDQVMVAANGFGIISECNIQSTDNGITTQGGIVTVGASSAIKIIDSYISTADAQAVAIDSVAEGDLEVRGCNFSILGIGVRHAAANPSFDGDVRITDNTFHVNGTSAVIVANGNSGVQNADKLSIDRNTVLNVTAAGDVISAGRATSTSVTGNSVFANVNGNVNVRAGLGETFEKSANVDNNAVYNTNTGINSGILLSTQVKHSHVNGNTIISDSTLGPGASGISIAGSAPNDSSVVDDNTVVSTGGGTSTITSTAPSITIGTNVVI